MDAMEDGQCVLEWSQGSSWGNVALEQLQSLATFWMKGKRSFGSRFEKWVNDYISPSLQRSLCDQHSILLEGRA
jgi:hypothetical protein